MEYREHIVSESSLLALTAMENYYTPTEDSNRDKITINGVSKKTQEVLFVEQNFLEDIALGYFNLCLMFLSMIEENTGEPQENVLQELRNLIHATDDYPEISETNSEKTHLVLDVLEVAIQFNSNDESTFNSFLELGEANGKLLVGLKNIAFMLLSSLTLTISVSETRIIKLIRDSILKI
jgi:hypothetical protein